MELRNQCGSFTDICTPKALVLVIPTVLEIFYQDLYTKALLLVIPTVLDKATNAVKSDTFESLTSTERLSTVSSPFMVHGTKTRIKTNENLLKTWVLWLFDFFRLYQFTWFKWRQIFPRNQLLKLRLLVKSAIPLDLQILSWGPYGLCYF